MRGKWVTPETTPAQTLVIKLYVPGGEDWAPAVRGALLLLCEARNWEQVTGITPEQTAQEFLNTVMQTIVLWEDCP